MKNVRKQWVLSTVAALMLLTACSSGSGDSGDSGNAGQKPANGQNKGGTEVTADKPEPEKKVEITVWDKPDPNNQVKAVYDELFAEFEQKYPHIKVNHEQAPKGESDRQVFVTAMAGGQGPDAYHLAHFPVIGDWINQGLALDLTSYWNEYADKDKFIPSSMATATVDGKIYGVPNNMYVMGLMYRKDLFQEAGLDPAKPPVNWQEFASYAQKLSKPDKQQYGYALLGMEWADWFFEYYVWQAGGDLTTRNEDGTVTLNFTKEPTVAALQYYKDLKWKYEAVQTNVLQGINDNKKDFAQGRAAMILGASDWFGGMFASGADPEQMGFAPFPAGPAGVAPSQTGGQYWIINPKISKEKQDAAWTYIQFRSSKEAMERLLQKQAENGTVPNMLAVRSDVDPRKFTEDVPADIVNGVIQAAENTQLEYFLKERLTPYVVKAVQKVLTDANADPKTALAEAEALAQREVVDPYNKDAKK
ncbi:extracellular solute-binding protein [Paenibacillus sp. GCM10027626]|uniref:extracellular solute-binding protein n=1 Tax=Paenibacillus sp. GCM10027626 TaxID=3273411 RepID=UPI0036411618